MKNFIKYSLKNLDINIILETSSGQGNETLYDLEEFIHFIKSFEEQENYHRLFICIDTCHIWNAGYELNEIISLIPNKNDILCIHLNNSKNIKGAKLDRHEYLFEGKINPLELKKFIYEFENSIIILEMPSNEYNKELLFLTNNLFNIFSNTGAKSFVSSVNICLINFFIIHFLNNHPLYL